VVKQFHEAVTQGRKTSARPTDNPPPGGQPFTIQPGQAVYIAVYKTTGAADLMVAPRVKNAFLKQKVFKITDQIGEADFVFLVYTEYTVQRMAAIGPDPGSVSQQEFVKRAQGFALSPEQYSRYKGNGDTLRAVAYWYQQVSPHTSIPESHSGQLVKQFHEAVTKGRKTSP